MAKVCFWNMRRLGEGTDDNRKEAVATVFKGIKADYTIFCELTTKSVYPSATNLTYRKTRVAQLCYGCVDAEGDNIIITRYTPTTTPEYEAAPFKGGTDFTLLADRAVGDIGSVKTAAIYVIHAPARKSSATKAMSYIACHFNAVYKNLPWLIIGDFNVEPVDLKKAPVGINLGDLIRAPADPTYIGGTKNKLYDYVLCNFDAKVSRIRTSPRGHNSDHYPIVVEW